LSKAVSASSHLFIWKKAKYRIIIPIFSDSYKQLIVNSHGIRPLVHLMKSSDIRVQRNAAGAILNLTHLREYKTSILNQL
jgi:hypothetical protein